MTDYAARAKAIALARSKQFAKKNPGTQELRDFIRTFEKLPADLRKEMRPLLKKSGDRALAKARQNSQWSRRIPGSLRVVVSLTKRSAGVSLTSNRLKAPHGRPFANLGKAGFFRVPTGKDPLPYARVAARPWFFDAGEGMTRDIDEQIGKIVDSVARSHGFR